MSDTSPLESEVWHELRVKADPLSWLPPYPLNNTNYFFKFVHLVDSAAFCLVLTDLCFVWIRRMAQKGIDQDMKKFNPSIRKQPTNATIKMIEQLLRENSAQQFHLVRLDMPQDDAAAVSASSASHQSPSLHLESSMSIGTSLLSFKWHFDLHSYGNHLEQATFLRNQMYIPLHEMIKVLACDAQNNKAKIAQLTAGGGGNGIAAAAATAHPRRRDPAAAAGGGDSLSIDLASSLSNPAGGAGVGAVIPANFNAYSDHYSFSQEVGGLYKSTMNRLNGIEDVPVSQNSASLLPNSFDDAAAAGMFAADADESKFKSSNRSALSSTGAGRRGTKRDRSLSPAVVPAAAAAASSSRVRARDAGDELDYKHNEDHVPIDDPSFSYPPPSLDLPPASVPLPSLMHASIQSSLDIAGVVDDVTGAYRESEAEKKKREDLARHLEEQKKRKKKKGFV